MDYFQDHSVIRWIRKNHIVVLFSVLFLFLLILSIFSEGTYGDADDICHYRFTRYAWMFPEFFFDQWNKPIFTLLGFPFAQLGFEGMRLFNIVLGLITAFLTYKTVLKLKLSSPWLVVFFIIFAPIYLSLLLSGMTEILFSLSIMLSVYLLYSKRFISAAIIVSFLPFCRIEGYLMIPIFFVALIYNKQWKALPFVFLGYIVYTLVGYPVMKDIFWVAHTFPYTTSSAAIYGHGDLLFYVHSAKSITGILLGILCLFGILISLIKYLRGGNFFDNDNINYFLIIFCPLFMLISFHSLAWWLGEGALALTRLMAPLIPLAAIFGLSGVDFLSQRIPFKSIRKVMLALILIVIVITPFKIYHIPVKVEGEQKQWKIVSNWFRTSEYKNDKIYYYNGFIYFFLNRNPFDEAKVHELVYDRDNPEKGIEPGSIVFWDAHFCPNEGKLPLNKLLNNPYFKLIRVFQPDEPFTVLGNYDFEIYMFQRLANPIKVDPHAAITPSKILFEKLIDFEGSQPIGINHFLSPLYHHSGEMSLKTSRDQEYYAEIPFTIPQTLAGKTIKIEASCFILSEVKSFCDNVMLVVSLQHNNDTYWYKASVIPPDSIAAGKWNELKINALIRNVRGKNDLLKVYIWVKDKKCVFIDDLYVKYLEN